MHIHDTDLTQSNLHQLAHYPINKLIAVQGELRPIEPEEIADQKNLTRVIEATFRYAATYPPINQRLWVNMGDRLISPGVIAQKLQLMPELQLPVEEEIFDNLGRFKPLPPELLGIICKNFCTTDFLAFYAVSKCFRAPIENQYYLWQPYVQRYIAKIGKSHALFNAVEKGYVNLTRFLITKEGYDPNSLASSNASLLNKAVESNQLRIVALLADLGADINKLALYGTPLIVAATKGHNQIAHLLLSLGSDPHFTDPKYLDSALTRAISHGHLSIVKLLQQYGVDLKKDDGGHAHLESAAANMHFGIVEYLLAQGVSVNSDNPKAKNPLRAALIWDELSKKQPEKRISMIKALLQAGAIIRCKESLLTSFIKAIYLDDIDIVAALLAQGADINGVVELMSTTPLAAAAAVSKEMVQYLLEQNANPHIGTHIGQTALMTASSCCRFEIVKLLIEWCRTKEGPEGVKRLINAADCDIETALMFALDYYREDPHSRMAEKELIKKEASNPSYYSVARILLEAGSNPNHKGYFGATPLHRADHHVGLQALLRRHGAKA